MPRRHPRIMAEETEKLQRELAEAKAEAAQHKATLSLLSDKFNGKKRKKEDLNQEFVGLISSCIKENIFKKMKFLSSDDQKLAYVHDIIKELDKEELIGDSAEAEAKRNEFILEYGWLCVAELNGQRNYVQSRLKTAAWTWMETHDNQLPPFQDILRCAQRRLPVTERNKNTILYYVDHMMPFMPGIKNEFTKKMRYYHTISTCKSKKNSSHIDITASIEAYGVLVMENAKTKWPKLFDLEKKEGPKKPGSRTYVLKKRDDDKPKKNTNNLYFYISDHPELDTKYTEPSSGQQDFGGWTTKGMNRYVTIWHAIRKARKKEYGKQWEANVLALMRDHYDITKETYELQCKENTGKVPAEEKKQTQEVKALTAAFDSDDDDEIELHEV